MLDGACDGRLRRERRIGDAGWRGEIEMVDRQQEGEKQRVCQGGGLEIQYSVVASDASEHDRQ